MTVNQNEGEAALEAVEENNLRHREVAALERIADALESLQGSVPETSGATQDEVA